MNDKLDLNALLILENELKVVLAISEYTKNQYSEITEEQYNFVVSICLYKDAKMKELKEAPLTGQLARHLLNRINNFIWGGANYRTIKDAISEFELEPTPDVIETLTRITNLLVKFITISNVILLQKKY